MRLVDIRVYPVKALRGASVDDAAVEPWGLAGDRRWMIVDADGRFVTQRTAARLALVAAIPTASGLRIEAPGEPPVEVGQPGPEADVCAVAVWNDTVPARRADAAADGVLTRIVGTPCGLVWLHDARARATDPAFAPVGSTVNFADGFPVLLGSLGSLAELNAWLPAPITIGRFRPNLVIDGVPPWAEDRWRRIRIGTAVFDVVKASDRCVVTTIDPETAERPDKTEPLRTLGRHRRDRSGGVMFGQNLVPATTGIVRIGDAVEVLDEGAPNVSLAPPPPVEAAGDGAGVGAA